MILHKIRVFAQPRFIRQFVKEGADADKEEEEEEEEEETNCQM